MRFSLPLAAMRSLPSKPSLSWPRQSRPHQGCSDALRCSRQSPVCNHAQTFWRIPLQTIVYHSLKDCLASGLVPGPAFRATFRIGMEHAPDRLVRSGALPGNSANGLGDDLGDGASADGAAALTNGEAAALLQG